MRQSASNVLAKIGEQRTPDNGQTTFTTASHHKRRTTAEILIETLGDQDRDFRLAAAEALGRIGDPVAHGALAVAIDDPDPTVQKAASAALDSIQGNRSRQDSAA